MATPRKQSSDTDHDFRTAVTVKNIQRLGLSLSEVDAFTLVEGLLGGGLCYCGPLPEDLSPFDRMVLEETRQIPFGETATYGDLAKRIGKPGAARAVGGALGRNPLPLLIPCHRVVGRGGALTGYSKGFAIKEALLAWEKRGNAP